MKKKIKAKTRKKNFFFRATPPWKYNNKNIFPLYKKSLLFALACEREVPSSFTWLAREKD
jgi:hypothetical protein